MKLPTLIVIASLPAAVAGVLLLGRAMDPAAGAGDAYWQFAALASLEAGWLRSLLLGLSFFLPLALVSAAVSRAWAGVFARARRQPLDQAWFASGFVFALALPAGMPPMYAALGLSFGLVFGSHVFGGSGRHVVPPIALALVFLQVSYPGLFEAGQWLPGQAVGSTWDSLHAERADALAMASPLALAARQTAAFGATSALACLAGLGLLLYRRAVAAEVVLGGLGAALLAGIAFDGAGGFVHPVVGGFFFALVFVATDPALKPGSVSGRWLFGSVFGALTVILRSADPAGPEGTWQALLLASLAAPLLDRIGPWLAQAARRRLVGTNGRERS